MGGLALEVVAQYEDLGLYFGTILAGCCAVYQVFVQW
jgi:hypothetical protein